MVEEEEVAEALINEDIEIDANEESVEEGEEMHDFEMVGEGE